MRLEWVTIIVGAALLLFGRRLFWLYVAGVGFVVGAMLATEWWPGRNDWLVAAVAVGLGLIGAILSIVMQRVVIAVAGFLAGGYLLHELAIGLHYETLAWIAFLVGGILGAILMLVLFDWALIMLSSLTGATVIVQNIHLERSVGLIVLVVLFVIGIVVQAMQLSHKVVVKEGEAKTP